MAGYSGTPLAKKLGIKEGASVALVSAFEGFEGLLEGMPADARVVREPRGKGPFDVIVVFVRSRADLERRFGGAVERLETAGGLWIAWPKKASGVATDMTEDVVRGVALRAGLVDNKVCAINETWSGLRVVRRVKDRPATPPRSRSRRVS
ncbi:MAG: DUF3052 family protein [Phycisphaeraceae bacterium]|nr:DUF3052 family protein [Phycisphaeraceae bacterium]